MSLGNRSMVMSKVKKQQIVFSKLLMAFAFLLWIFDRATNRLSDLLGKWLCGNEYMQPVDGYIGDRSCGFNMDMHLSLFLILLFVLGLISYLVSKKR